MFPDRRCHCDAPLENHTLSAVLGYPVLPRAGLANMLIPWAECYLWCQDQGVERLSPIWTKARVGPRLRRERDPRQYQRLFSAGTQITGLRRLALLATARRVSADRWRDGWARLPTNRSTLVCFNDMNHFERLVGRHREVGAELVRMTRPQYRPPSLDGPFIGVHVRMGDYPPRGEGPTQLVFRLPLSWYTAGLQELRRALGEDLPAIVFSDGTDSELGPLLALRNVQRSPFATAITDLLALSAGAAIVTSRSTFSLWAAYLGQIPALWFPPKADICGRGVFPGDQGIELEIEWQPGDDLPRPFVAAVRQRCGSVRAGH